MSEHQRKRLSDLMLMSAFICTLFYSMSYPYIYIELVKAVTRPYITFDQIANCLGIAVIGTVWNKHGDKLFKHYVAIVWIEIIADLILFACVLVTHNLKAYYILSILICSIITRNMACGGVKMRAKVNPTEQLREKYDNNVNTAYAIATICGALGAVLLHLSLTALFIIAMLGGVIDNFAYLYIYHQLNRYSTHNLSRKG